MIGPLEAVVSATCSRPALGVKCRIQSHSIRMSDTKTKNQPAPVPTPSERDAELNQSSKPREFGGPKGPEPTRYGDWEKGGRCIDF